MNSKIFPILVRPVLESLLVFTALLIQGAYPVAAQTVTPAHVNADIACDQTPFGHRLELGQEKELFLSLKNPSAPHPSALDWSIHDLDTATGQLHPTAVADISTTPSNISALAATSADLDGNGKTEFVQGFTDASGKYQILVHKNGSTDQTHTENWPNYTNRAMAAGDILGQDNGAQQLVIASRGGDGALNVAVFSNTVSSGIGSPVALWSANGITRTQATNIQVAIGNLDNDPYADIVVSFLQKDGQTAQMIDLEYQPAGGTNPTATLQERAKATYFVGAGTFGPQSLQMKLVDLAGSGQDRVVLAWDQGGSLGGLSPRISLRTFDVLDINGTTQFVNREQWSGQSNSLNFALAAGDINGDHRDEIILGYDTEGNSSFGNLNVVALDLINQDTPTSSFSEISHWQDAADGRNITNYLALAVGDFDKDNRNEVAVAFKDAEPFGFQLLYLKFGPTGLKLGTWGRQDPNLDAPVSLVFGDWDNDSLRAFAKGKCAKVVDAHVTAADFIPPYWQNIQGSQSKGGSIGQSISQEDTVERSLTYHRSDSVSAYVGLSAGVSFFDIAEFSASAKATGAQEYAMSDRKTTSNGTSTVTTIGQSWNDAAVIYEPAEYKCFSYQMSVNNVFISTDQARLRFCQYQTGDNTKPALQSSEVDSWDINFGDKPEYVPVVRDWSSLALFRGNATDQSSNKTTARLAVDSEIVHGSFISGTVAQTNGGENNPWWQVDLGSVQKISKIRLWAPKAGLANFYLFISNHAFSATDTPATLLAQPDIAHYTLAGLDNGWVMTDTAGPLTTFSTLNSQHNPIQGQFVRVQRADAGVLALAEVQVFGQNHSDPDRYPLDLCDEGVPNKDTACDITKNDGYFKVRLYNPYHTSDSDKYVWVKTRGHVLWDGRKNDALNGMSITRGNTGPNWSISQGTVTSKAQAQELDNTTSVGAEFEVEGGAGIKVQTGAGIEHTSGVASEVVQSTAWGNELNMGGQMQGFPPAYNGHENDWVLNCRYFFQPYYYELTETSNLGYQHHFPVLDYLVPDKSRDSDLNRTRDLAACRNGNLPAATPQTLNDTAQVAAGTPITLSVLANDQGNNLTISDVSAPQHGTVSHTARTITYMPNADFQGTDSFIYTINSAAVVAAGANSTTTGTVTVTVGAASGSGTAVYLPLIQR